jgi:hypothetical protein
MVLVGFYLTFGRSIDFFGFILPIRLTVCMYAFWLGVRNISIKPPSYLNNVKVKKLTLIWSLKYLFLQNIEIIDNNTNK